MNSSEPRASIATELARGTAELRGLPSSRLDAELLLAWLLGRSRAWLLAHAEQSLAPAIATRFRAQLARRAQGEPLAYISGRREFWSLDLEVNPAVLVPRPETELLVERALALLPDRTADVADLGTGSGAIALACASERPQWRITATDVSPAALAVATLNATRLSLGNIRFLQGSWYEPLGAEHFDLLLSNPPYVAADDPALADPALRHEPQTALVAANQGLADLSALVAGAPAHLRPGGWLLLEHGAGQARVVAEMLVSQTWAHVRCHADLAGHDRVTEAQLRRD